MCQIIVKSYKNSKNFLNDFNNLEKYEKELYIKGGVNDGFSISLFIPNEKAIISKGWTFKKTLDKFRSKCEKKELNFKEDKYNNAVIALFSRQRPEMENSGKIKLPPYKNKKTGEYYFVHGTISNDKILAKIYDKKLSVDTEIFKYLKRKELNLVQGLYSYISINKKNKTRMFDNGMGFYKFTYDNVLTYSTTNLLKPTLSKIPKYIPKNKAIKLKIAFSGGMDSVLNTFKSIHDLQKIISVDQAYIDIELIYFDYGANATESEIKAAEKFILFIKKQFPSLEINLTILDMKIFMEETVFLTNDYSKLLDSSAVGDKQETESTLAYVPFRNTLMTQILTARAQKEFDELKNFSQINQKIFIGLGLNLTDGQVYGDNNIAWLEHTEKMLSYGGKRFNSVKIISPYINRTKINMLKEFKQEFGTELLELLLDISFSCYYPKNGESCGKCGSCILRKKAIKKL